MKRTARLGVGAKSLARRSTFAAKPKRLERRRRPPVDRRSTADFKAAAAAQLGCAVCGRTIDMATGYEIPWVAHHVLERQELRRLGAHEWDPRDALRLCDPIADTCHGRHHSGERRIRRSELRPENIAYVLEVLGREAGEAYLERRYPD